VRGAIHLIVYKGCFPGNGKFFTEAAIATYLGTSSLDFLFRSSPAVSLFDVLFGPLSVLSSLDVLFGP
jgi:hypothetical protein